MIGRTRLRVFDDGHILYPFTLTRPAIDLRVGALRLWEKVAVVAGDRIGLLVPDWIAPIVVSAAAQGVALTVMVAVLLSAAPALFETRTQ